MRASILAGVFVIVSGACQAAEYSCTAAGQQPVAYRVERGQIMNLKDSGQFTTLRQGKGYIIGARPAATADAVSVMLINTSENKFRLTVIMGDGRVGSLDGFCQVIPNASPESERSTKTRSRPR